MKAVGVTAAGGPEVLAVVDVPIPEPRPGQVRVRVHAAAINPSDLGLRTLGAAGQMSGEPPWVPGMDAAGRVDAVTEGSSFAVGDRVMAMVVPFGQRLGAQAEYAIMPEEAVARIPDGVTYAEASTIPMNAMTAHYALAEMNLTPGDTVAVTGGGGWLASLFIPMAKTRGLTVIADSSDEDAERVKSLGADFVVPRGAGLASRISQIFPDGVDGVLDALGFGEEIMPILKDNGQYVAVRGWSGEAPRGITARGILVGAYARTAGAMTEIGQLLADGVITPRVAAEYDPSEATAAHQRFESGGTRGRLVFRFGEED